MVETTTSPSIDELAQLLQVDLGSPEIDMTAYLLALAEQILND